MNEISLDEMWMKEHIRSEFERHRKFESRLLGVKSTAVKIADIDIRNYAKYILRDGTISEKRELITCLRSKITMAEKKIKIA